MTIQKQTVSLKKLWWVAPLSIVATILANLVTLFILDVIFQLDDAFPPFQPIPIIIVTIMYLIVAILAYILVARFSSNPVRLYNIIALIALIVSFIPNIGLMLNPSGVPFTGTPFDFGILMIFHVVAWAVFVQLVTRLTIEK